MTAVEFQYKLIGLQDGLIRFAYFLTTNKNDAKDLVQETFLKALVNCNKFILETNFKAWTFTIMRNTFINNYRRSIRNNTFRNQTKEGYNLNYTPVSNSDDPDSIYTSNELQQMIENLEDNLKNPFKMYHEGFKYKEIAETLELNLGTVKSRIFFARKKLMKNLSM
jgi:RNA polymerase sigma-70 factor, ECF subfamily